MVGGSGMPGSILMNGRGSTSPDRHVTFGNIERYDILTSNEIRDNKVKRQYGGTLITPSGSYPMTRLDIRIRKAILLGFNYLPGDTVAYSEIVEFLLEFGVIVNKKNCTQRQITAIIQASYPKVIIKPSAKHSVIFVNLENRSDDVIKEELIRVTTEPIIDPIEQSNLNVLEWIKAETEKFNKEFEYGEDEELKSIEEKTKLKQLSNEEEIALNKRFSAASLPLISSSPLHDLSQDVSDVGGMGLSGMDKSQSSGDNTEELIHPPPDIEQLPDLISNVNDVKTVDEGIAKSQSVNDLASSLEMKATKLKRTHSFQRSTDRGYVGSIRDRFRNLIEAKADELDQELIKPIDVKSINKFNKYETSAMSQFEKYKASPNTATTITNSNEKISSTVAVRRKSGGGGVMNGHQKPTAPDSATSSNASTPTPSSQKFSSTTDLSEGREGGNKFAPRTLSVSSLQTSIRRTNSFRSCKLNGEGQSDGFRSSTNQRYPSEGNDKITVKSTSRPGLSSSQSESTKSLSRKNSFRDNKTSTLRINGSNISLNKDHPTRAASSNDLSNSKATYRRSAYHSHDKELSSSRQSLNSDTSSSKSAFGGGRRFHNTSNLALNKDASCKMQDGPSVSRNNSIRLTAKQKQDAKTSTYTSIIDRATQRSHNNTSSNGSTKSSQNTKTSFYKLSYSERNKQNMAANKKHQSTLKMSSQKEVAMKRKTSNRRNSIETTASSITSSLTSSMCSSPDLSSDMDLSSIDLNENHNNNNNNNNNNNGNGNSEPFQSKEEKDIIRIAKAFQKAKIQTETINDNIARFMKRVATEDLELSNNNRLSLDALYKHIREKMILAKDEIFEGTRSEFTVEMSQYFDLLFTTLATHLDRVGCEIITDQTTGAKSCYLTHVRFIEEQNESPEEDV